MQQQTVVQILDQALDMYGEDLAIAFSGAEDVALIQYAALTGKPFRVFSLDTGRLNPETYQLFDDVEKVRVALTKSRLPVLSLSW